MPPSRGGRVLCWGVLAPGTIAGDFVATVRANTDQRVTAVASRSAERGRRFAGRHAIDRVHGRQAAVTTSMAVTATGLAAIHGTRGSARFLDPFVFPARFVVETEGDRHEWHDTSGLLGRAGLARQTTALAQYIADGRTASPARGLDDAISVLRTIDAVRGQLGRQEASERAAPDA